METRKKEGQVITRVSGSNLAAVAMPIPMASKMDRNTLLNSVADAAMGPIKPTFTVLIASSLMSAPNARSYSLASRYH